ncbi:MAG: VCBS repeat-containing protein [Planctomycetes bacterium]|nr:VCBS repeat-containing protein [Planctomycetota bacterium]
MADPVFRSKFQRMPRNVLSWLDCLIRGRRRRQQRRAVSDAPVAAGVQQLEDRTLLTVVPFAAEFEVTATADGARSITAADIDGDGDLDYLSASENDGTITWWENVAGDGSAFVRHDVTTFADGARSVVAADIDGDGDLDIVSASAIDDTIAWYENTAGDGSAWTKMEISIIADGARSVAVADIDGDGDLDVISASYEDDKIAWYENTAGDGSAWTEIVVTTSADGANSVVAADIDGDGDIDIVSASLLDDTISWYDNASGDGLAFSTTAISTTSTGASSVFAADIDGDGDIDIVSAASGDDTVSWHENNGAATPTFTERVVNILADGVNQVIVADVDSDGDMDILSASPLDDTISWFENDGDLFDPVFTARTISTAADGAYSVVAADIDGDGDIDVASASGLDDKLALYENETIHRGALFAAPVTLSSAADGAYSVVIGDIDGDGDLDIVASSVYDNTIRWYENDGDPTTPSFTERIVTTTMLNGPRQIHLADVDNDGNLDVVSASAVNNTVEWWWNTAGDGSAWTGFTVHTGAMAVRAVFSADIDGDGDLDLLSASSGDNTIRWYESGVGTVPSFTTRIIATDVTGVRTIVAGDVDGDGDIDVITASYDDDRVLWYENIDGDGTVWARRILTSSADGARSVAVADVDGDGDLDILSASTYDHSIRWFENDGAANPLFAVHVLSSGEQGAQYVNAVDFDNDGDVDIISVAEFPDLTDVSRIAWFENDGAADPSFTRSTIDTKNDRPVTVDTGDLDGDGDPDVVSASIFDDSVLFYRNGGGQLGLATEDTSSSFITAGKFDDVLKITATHNGRTGDSDLEIATFELRFERSPGVPLTTPEANLLIFDVEIFLDDGDGLFDVADDTSVLVVDPLALDLDGNQVVTFADGDADVLITLGTPRVYFVVVEITANAFLLDPNTFIVTHVTEASSTAEDAANDITATVDSVTNVSTPLLDVGQPAVPLPGVPTITGPIGITTDTTPTFTWTALTAAPA